MPAFEKQIRGYSLHDAVLTGIETRTSSPLRITRNESMQSLNVKGLFPAGEGAGYAGGILSAGVDGIRIAEAVARDILGLRSLEQHPCGSSLLPQRCFMGAISDKSTSDIGAQNAGRQRLTPLDRRRNRRDQPSQLIPLGLEPGLIVVGRRIAFAAITQIATIDPASPAAVICCAAIKAPIRLVPLDPPTCRPKRSAR